jgi:hypothetical protein
METSEGRDIRKKAVKDLSEIEKYRAKDKAFGRFATTEEDGANGMFRIPKWGKTFRCIVSDGLDGTGWEHVSVSKEGKQTCPTWEEMDWVKNVFWRSDEVAIQIHPAKSENISYADYCLHLWRPIDVELPLPDPEMVGPLVMKGM